MSPGTPGKKKADAVAAEMAKTELDILEGTIEYGVAWLDKLVKNSKKPDNIRMMALRTAKSFRDFNRKQDAAGVDRKKGKGGKKLRKSVEADLAKLRAGADKPAEGSE